MLDFIKRFVCGWREVEVPSESRACAADIIYRNEVSCEREKITEGGVVFTLRESAYRKIKPEFDACGLSCCTGRLHGLPSVLAFMKKRPMIPVGFLLMLVWLEYSSRIIWDIRIEGNDKTPDEKIIASLTELGCGVGDYYPKIDFNQLHADYLASQSDIAWLSVFMNGTVAEVQVRELYAPDRVVHEDGVYANVTASCDGVVEEVNVFEGQAAVKKGDVVREGQVLISGIVQGKEEGDFRYEYAAGEVICSVPVSLSERVELDSEKKVYTGREKTEKTVKFFKTSLNLFIKGGIMYDKYDKIDRMEQLCPLGLAKIPVFVETVTYREYETEKVRLEPQEAVDKAMYSLSRRIKEQAVLGELESKEIRTKFEDGVYEVRCLLYMRRDIGVASEFREGQIVD